MRIPLNIANVAIETPLLFRYICRILYHIINLFPQHTKDTVYS